MSLDISTEKPKFRQYAPVARRLETFWQLEWPSHCPVSVQDLVDAGLVYTGVGDSVKCYNCGGGLRNWELGDDPMVEHARWYPNCQHVLLVKGKQYVQNVTDGLDPNQQTKPCSESHYLKPDAAQALIEYRYSIADVLKSIRIFQNRYGDHTPFSGQDLCTILIEINPELAPNILEVEIDGTRSLQDDDNKSYCSGYHSCFHLDARGYVSAKTDIQMTKYDKLTKKTKDNLRVRRSCGSKLSIQNALGCMLALCLTSAFRRVGRMCVSKHSIQNVLGCMLALCLTSAIGCDIMNKNMCQTNFHQTFNQSDKEAFTRLHIHRRCSTRDYDSPKCEGDTTYKCIQNDFGFTIEFCSPIWCSRDYLSCIVYYDETTSSVVWIEFRKCDYGYFSNPYSKCHKDVRVERSRLYPNKAYCDWQNDFYNKEEVMYFDVTTTRDYRKLCVQNNAHCGSGKRPLPDGTCSPICGRDEVRTELSGFSCVSPDRELELRNLTTTGRVITKQENSEQTTGRGSSTSPTRGSFNSPTTRTPRTLSSKPTDAPSYKPGDLFHGIHIRGEQHREHMTRLTIVLISIVSVIAVIVVIAAVFMAMKNGGSDISNSNIPPSCSDDGWQPTVEVPWQNREMDDRDMSFIARNIGAGWETLASHLQCSRVSIDHIKSDKSNMGVQILTMLQQWKQQHHQATLQDFNEEMRDMRTVKDVSIQWSALDSRFGIPDNAL